MLIKLSIHRLRQVSKLALRTFYQWVKVFHPLTGFKQVAFGNPTRRIDSVNRNQPKEDRIMIFHDYNSGKGDLISSLRNQK